MFEHSVLYCSESIFLFDYHFFNIRTKPNHKRYVFLLILSGRFIRRITSLYARIDFDKKVGPKSYHSMKVDPLKAQNHLVFFYLLKKIAVVFGFLRPLGEVQLIQEYSFGEGTLMIDYFLFQRVILTLDAV